MTEEKLKARRGFGRTFGLVAVLTVLSKLVGLARDIIVTAAYGTGFVADAYNYAYLLTGNILVLFGGLGGPFHSSTVTVLSARQNEHNRGALLAQMFWFTFLVLLVVTIGIWLLAPNLASLMATEYKPEHFLRISADKLLELRSLFASQVMMQLNIMLPLIVIAGLIGLSYGVLNVYNKVFWPSFSPAIASVAIIIAVVGFSDPKTRLITGIPLAVGTLAGACGQLLAQILDLSKLNLKFELTLKIQPGFASYLLMLWPAILSTSVGQLTVYVDGFFTLKWLGEGEWTAIINANRLIQLPLGVLLTAMLVPILPRFTELVTIQHIDELKMELLRALRFLWFLSLPVIAIFMVIPSAIVAVLFQRGNFDEHSTAIVTTALVYLVPSIFFYVARDLITRVFYAFQDAKTPYYVAVIAIAVKFLLDWVLVQILGIGGISLATTLITIMNLGLLTFFLNKKIGLVKYALLVRPLGVMFLAAALCGLTVYAVYGWLASFENSWLMQFTAVITASTMGLAAFWLVSILCRLEEPILVAKILVAMPLVREWLKAREGK